jgi:hypothetical protein
MKTVAILWVACAALAACGEKPQTAGTKKADVAAFNGTDASNAGYVAQGWKPGDPVSWETQMKSRAQGQNENSRSTQ